MIDGKLDIVDVFEALKGYAINAAGRNGKQCNVIIGNAGRDGFGTRTFKAASFETIVKQVKKAYGPVPENAK
jgi:hypothetical protein